MFFKKPLKNFLFLAVNIVIGLSLIAAFTLSARHIMRTVHMARFVGLGPLKPEPMDYFFQIDLHHAALDKNKVRYYADYYENLLQVFPTMIDAYGILGYCYHYLGDDLKAKEFFKKAVEGGSNYFWFTYDLAVLYIIDRDYHAGMELLRKALQIDPQVSLKSLTSQTINPLLPQPFPVNDIAAHLGQGYKQSSILYNLLNLSQSQSRAADIIKKLELDIYVF